MLRQRTGGYIRVTIIGLLEGPFTTRFIVPLFQTLDVSPDERHNNFLTAHSSFIHGVANMEQKGST